MQTSLDIFGTYRCEYCGDTRSYDWGLVDVADAAGQTKCACLNCYEKVAESVTVVGD